MRKDKDFFGLAQKNYKEADRSEFSLLPGIMFPLFEGSLLLKILSLWSFHVLAALKTKFCFVTYDFTIGIISDDTEIKV